MAEPEVLSELDARGIAWVTLNRPEVNNAYNQAMIEGLLEACGRFGSDPGVRLIILRGNGRFFQAGADLAFMAELGEQPLEDNLHMSRITTDVARFLDCCPRPTMALVHGGCFGGGTGMMAACDIVLASEEAKFAITEVRWGLVAGPIIPQLAAAMGTRALRRYALTAERFTAAQAKEMGLVHEVCPTGGLDAAAAPIIDQILQCSGSAISKTKQIIRDIADTDVDDGLATALTHDHAMRRRTEDAKEGLASFKEKRPARWYPGPAQAAD